jgi:hypothetical protein
VKKKTHDSQKILFKFRCVKCYKKQEIDIYEILEVGNPICCDEEMEIENFCTLK